MGTAGALNDTATFQGILNKRANTVPELNDYKFEDNQRVGELAVVLMLSRTINKLYERSFVPAWQLSGQEAVMEAFTGKKSWDGFVYEPGDPSTPVTPVPVEVKSTMVHPTKTVITDPDQLLKDGLPRFKKHFQSEGSLCVVFVMPYTSKPGLSFDLKDATMNMNGVVADDAASFVCLLSFPENEAGDTVITMHCYHVDKEPDMAANGKIEHATLTVMTFGTI